MIILDHIGSQVRRLDSHLLGIDTCLKVPFDIF